MSIRNSSKAVVLHQGKILLHRCRTEEGEIYYDLPGGGQHPFETMEQALLREVHEETGLQVQVERFLALGEEITADEALRRAYPQYCHRVAHIFLAHLQAQEFSDGLPGGEETDEGWQQTVWVPLAQADTLPLYPLALRGRLCALLAGQADPWLGSAYAP